MEPVDFVYTWVDGSDPLHQKKRRHYIDDFETKFESSEATDDFRWLNSREIEYSLRSVEKFAPWVRKIWIVTDGQTFTPPPADNHFKSKIEFVDHSIIFKGFEQALPTFNSISIETMLWRIPGLAENFVYFNDDVFLANQTKPSDFFRNDGIIARGARSSFHYENELLYNRHKRNARSLLPEAPGFSNAHVSISAKKSYFEDFFRANPGLLKKNIEHRFRHEEQFSAFALSTLLASSRGQCLNKIYKDYQFVTANLSLNGSDQEIKRSIEKIFRPHILLACINHVPALTARGIDVDEIWERVLSDRPESHATRALRYLPARKINS